MVYKGHNYSAMIYWTHNLLTKSRVQRLQHLIELPNFPGPKGSILRIRIRSGPYPLCIVVFIPALPTAAGVHPSPSSGLYPVTLRRYCDLHQSTTFAYFLIVIAVFQSRKSTPFSPVRAEGFASFRFGGNF